MELWLIIQKSNLYRTKTLTTKEIRRCWYTGEIVGRANLDKDPWHGYLGERSNILLFISCLSTFLFLCSFLGVRQSWNQEPQITFHPLISLKLLVTCCSYWTHVLLKVFAYILLFKSPLIYCELKAHWDVGLLLFIAPFGLIFLRLIR